MPGRHGDISAFSVAVATTDEIVEIIIPEGSEQLSLELSVVDNALDAFEVITKATEDAAGVVIASAGADFTTATLEYPILCCTSDISALAAAASAFFMMNVKGLYSVAFKASAAVGVSKADLHWGIR